ncbi:MAG: SGNH/GDSL hydrolase family protein [Acutalibacteraceae bacterium]|nr:SGNH/GDSL hydrolase family protein [Acutalibacteraceae bacterium]
MKIKKVIIIALLLATVGVFTGCDFTAFANSAETIQPTEAVTEPEPPKKNCKLQIQSYDKQNLTDEISYTVEKVGKNGEATVVENVNTTNGLGHIDLEAGDYRIVANAGDFKKSFTVLDNETSMVIEAENNKMYQVLSSANGVCVVGDSITIGSSSGGYGWYDGLMDRFPNIKTIDVAATGGQTSASIFDNTNDVQAINNSKADTYIIALGINDVIYREKKTNSTTYTTAEYIKKLEDLVEYINSKNTEKPIKFVFIAPFEYVNKHSYQMPKYIHRENTHQEYTIALSNWCSMNGYAFTAPMNYVKNTLEAVDNASEYTVDDVHPAYPLGTQLYSKAVYESSVVDLNGSLRISQKFYNESNRNFADSNYKTYPIDYQQVSVDNNIVSKSRFTIKDYNTGKYVALKENSKGELELEELSNIPHYYYPDENGEITINNLPKGGYIVNLKDNSLGYTSYLDTKIVFVNGGDITTNAYIHMKNNK